MTASTSELERVARLVVERNALDAEIAAVMGRPVTAGHLGEWIAARIFEIELEESAVTRSIDGRFRSGALAGETVNMKWYGKLEGMLDMTADPALDHYLVLAGTRAAASSSRGTLRPLVIASVHLIDAAKLAGDLTARGRKLGTATSVRREWWDRHEVHPRDNHPVVHLSDEQRRMLALFAP